MSRLDSSDIVLFVYCQASEPSRIVGKWKVIEIKNTINIDKFYWDEFKLNCLAEIAEIKCIDTRIILSISEKCDQDGDFKKCDTISLTDIELKIKADKDTVIKQLEIEFYSDSGYVNKTFMNLVKGKYENDTLFGYSTNCPISWGEGKLNRNSA